MDEGKSLAGTADRGYNANYRHATATLSPDPSPPTRTRVRGSLTTAFLGTPRFPRAALPQMRAQEIPRRLQVLEAAERHQSAGHGDVRFFSAPEAPQAPHPHTPESRAGLPTPPGSGQRPCRRYHACAEQTRKGRRINPECQRCPRGLGKGAKSSGCGASVGVGGVD